MDCAPPPIAMGEPAVWVTVFTGVTTLAAAVPETTYAITSLMMLPPPSQPCKTRVSPPFLRIDDPQVAPRHHPLRIPLAMTEFDDLSLSAGCPENRRARASVYLASNCTSRLQY